MPSLNVQCPNCGKQYLKIKSNLIGHRVQCECGTVFRLGDAADKIDRKPLRQQKDRKNSPVAAHPEPPPTNRLPVAVPKMSSTLFEEDLPGLTDPVPEPPPIALERPPIATEEPYVVAALSDDEFPVLVESEPIANTTGEQFVLADPVFADGELDDFSAPLTASTESAGEVSSPASSPRRAQKEVKTKMDGLSWFSVVVLAIVNLLFLGVYLISLRKLSFADMEFQSSFLNEHPAALAAVPALSGLFLALKSIFGLFIGCHYGRFFYRTRGIDGKINNWGELSLGTLFAFWGFSEVLKCL